MSADTPPRLVHLADRTIDLSRHEVRAGSDIFPLTPREAEALAYLAERADTVVSRERLERDVWGFHPGVRSEAVPVAMRRLRSKLEADSESPKSLITVAGVGWRLDTVKPEAPAPVAEALSGPVGPAMPEGLVAIVATEIEDLAHLWESAPEAMRAASALLHRTTRELLSRFHGYEASLVGDHALLLFRGPVQALRFCAAAQLAYQELDWPPLIASRADGPSGLRVAMGVGIGVPDRTVEEATGQIELHGPAITRVSRMAEAAHGGQILASEDAWRAAVDRLGGELEVVALGPHLLRGLERPEELVQISPPALGHLRFPPIRAEGARATNLQPHSTPLVGREAVVAEILASLTEEGRLHTLVGAGGAGKSRVAIEICLALAPQRAGGAWLFDLGEVSSVDEIATTVARELGLGLPRGEAALAMGQLLHSRGSTLLVLDNVDHLVETLPRLVGQILRGAAQLQIIATSRERLRIPGERVWPIDPLPLTGDPSPALVLLEQRARAVRPDLDHRPQTRATLTEIVRRLDGLPLALELAAARMRVLTPEQVLDRLDDRFRLLGGARGRPPRQASLRAAIEGSWAPLALWERAALADLSVMQGPFSLEEAEAVVDLSTWPTAPWPIDVVEALVDKSLLRLLPADHEGLARLSMLGSIRAFASEELASRDPRGPTASAAAEARHGRHFAQLGSPAALEALEGSGAAPLRRALAASVEQVLAATRRAALRGDGAVALPGLRAIWVLVEMAGPFSLVVDLAGAVTRGATDDRTRAGAGVILGMALRYERRLNESWQELQEALRLATAVGDPQLIEDAWDELTNLASELGRVDLAEDWARAALDSAKARGDRRVAGRAMARLAWLRADQGQLADAERYYQRAREWLSAVGNRRWEGVLLGNLANVYLETGQISAAHACQSAALEIHRELGDLRGEAIVLGNMGVAAWELGRLDEAIRTLERALELQHRIGLTDHEAMSWCVLGNVRQELGEGAEARIAMHRARELAEQSGDRRTELVVEGTLGELMLEQGDLDQAEVRLRTAVTVADSIGAVAPLSAFRAALALLLARRGLAEAARAELAAAEACLGEEGLAPQRALTICRRVEISRVLGQEEERRRSPPARRAQRGWSPGCSRSDPGPDAPPSPTWPPHTSSGQRSAFSGQPLHLDVDSVRIEGASKMHVPKLPTDNNQADP